MVASVMSRLSEMNFADAGRIGGDAVGNLREFVTPLRADEDHLLLHWPNRPASAE
jgi:hypothetical protein